MSLCSSSAVTLFLIFLINGCSTNTTTTSTPDGSFNSNSTLDRQEVNPVQESIAAIGESEGALETLGNVFYLLTNILKGIVDVPAQAITGIIKETKPKPTATVAIVTPRPIQASPVLTNNKPSLQSYQQQIQELQQKQLLQQLLEQSKEPHQQKLIQQLLQQTQKQASLETPSNPVVATQHTQFVAFPLAPITSRPPTERPTERPTEPEDGEYDGDLNVLDKF